MFKNDRATLTWRAGALLLTAGLASVALTGTSQAAGSSHTHHDAALVCRGLTADATFARERVTLGGAHACEHLTDRSAAEGSVVRMVGEVVHARIAMATAAAQPTTRPASSVGRWSAARNPGTTTIGITSVVMHNGKVLMFGQYTAGGTTAYVYDPVTRTGREFPAPAPIFCSSVTPLADGRILIVGGADPIPRGIEDIWLFDPGTEQWSQQPDSPLGRYYPTSTRLPDGRVIITAGHEVDGATHNPTVEVYSPPANRLAASGTMEVVGGPHVTDYYPHQLVMRNGKMLQVDGGLSYMLNPATWRWTQLGDLPLPADGAGGAAHLFLPGGPRGATEVMMIGGLRGGKGTTARQSVQRFDHAHPGEGWRLGPALPNPRAHMNVVQVPDGSAYGIGGNSLGRREVPRRATLHFNPETNRWRILAAQAPQRTYHSTAVLLPDGRIMSAGDNGVAGGRQLIDFYSPPYLFRGRRPVIDRAPRRLAYGQQFRIRISRSAGTEAVLMAPAATTHANEMNARHVPLTVRPTANGLLATAPRTANVAPPGYYMLFTLNAKGVPSVARWVRVG
ncbi:MAG: DUF1929 domain-containing protein [Actinomycetota bacterium]|nr:DUF1929 domain-containing protein [Actinomycetota bacterium]